MPFTTSNDGVRIHYELAGSGPAIILHHGFTGTLEAWHTYGYVEPLQRDYRLVLFDARGHGESDMPHDTAAYDEPVMARDLVAVLDAAGIEHAAFWGYSHGGRVGLAAAVEIPQRFDAFVLGGVSPRYTAEERADVGDAFDALLTDGVEGYLAAIEAARGAPLEPLRRQRVLSLDAKALIAAREATLRAPSYWDRLGSIPKPCLFYTAAEDPRAEGAAEAARIVPAGEYASLPGIGHLEGMRRVDLALPVVRAFLDRVLRPGA